MQPEKVEIWMTICVIPKNRSKPKRVLENPLGNAVVQTKEKFKSKELVKTLNR
jgi:hypothetical protein